MKSVIRADGALASAAPDRPPAVFAAAGFVTQSSQTAVTAWAVGAGDVPSTLIVIAFVDRIGRRKLLLTGRSAWASASPSSAAPATS